MSSHSLRTPHTGWSILAVVWLSLNLVFAALTEPGGRARLPAPDLPSPAVCALYTSSSEPERMCGGLGAGLRLSFRLMAPAAAEGEPAPLLVFLHGAGQCGSDNLQQLRGLPEQMALPHWRRRYPCYLLAPQCPKGAHWSDAMSDLTQLIDALLEGCPVDRRRVYLTGLSMGGFGSWELAARRPDLFAAVVPICGGGDPPWADSLVATPIWAVHGGADESVPAAHSREMIDAVIAAGGRPRYTELPGVGHDSWTPAYRDPHGVLQWMFEQIREPP